MGELTGFKVSNPWYRLYLGDERNSASVPRPDTKMRQSTIVVNVGKFIILFIICLI